MQKRPLETDRCGPANAASSVFLLIDVQEKLLPAISRGSGVVEGCRFLLECCQLFGVPAVVSEQYPRGLGMTVSALSSHPAILDRFEKLRFSATEGFLKLQQSGRDQVIIGGIEAHICVLQTALELRTAGKQVFLCTDAVGSRKEFERDLAFRRLEQAGCVITSTESIAFEWCQAAGTSAFKQLSQLVKTRDAST